MPDPDLPPAEAELLARAWPDGVPADEVRLLRALTEVRRDKVLRRLRVLLDIGAARQEDSAARVDMVARASDAGLTVDGLFAVRRKWEAEPSIRSIAPYLGRSERQATQRRADDPVVIAARAMLAGDATSSDSILAARLVRDLGGSVPNLIRLVRRLRREEAGDPDQIARVFGRALLIDLCAIDRVTPGEPSVPYVCAVVVERASGLILAHEVTDVDGWTLAAQEGAVRGAIGRIGSARLDAYTDETAPFAAVELTLGDGANAGAAFEAAALLKEAGIDLRVNSTGPRRYGQRVVSLLGKRFGPLWWRPRSSAPGSPAPAVDAMRVVRSSDIGLVVEEAVAEHNAMVERALAEGGVAVGWGSPHGAMTAALKRVLEVLTAR